jgi:hypothetical protein
MKMLIYLSTLIVHISSYIIILANEKIDLNVLLLIIPICLIAGLMIMLFKNSINEKMIDVGRGLLFASGTSIAMIMLFNTYKG